MEYGKGLFALGVVSIIGLAYVRFYQDSYTPSTAEQTADSIDAKLDAEPAMTWTRPSPAMVTKTVTDINQTADSIDAKLDAMDAKLDKLIEKMEQEKQ